MTQAKTTIGVTAGATTYVNFFAFERATATTTAPYEICETDSDLPAGTYSVLCQATSYRDFGRIGIVVTAGATTYVNFPLTPR